MLNIIIFDKYLGPFDDYHRTPPPVIHSLSSYEDNRAALNWLQSAFGFEASEVLTDANGNIALAHARLFRMARWYNESHRNAECWTGSSVMNPWFGNVLMLISIVSTVIIRAPHAGRRRKVVILESRKGWLEIGLLALMWIAVIILPLVAIFTSLLAFADYPLHPVAFIIGVVVLCPGLWLFYRSHADLGMNWSISLEIREDHQLVTSGVYRLVRHPMYTAIFLQAFAQGFLLSNWLAGPSCLLAFLPMFVLRVRREEQMMHKTFAEAYVDYMNKTNRLIPRLW